VLSSSATICIAFLNHRPVAFADYAAINVRGTGADTLGLEGANFGRFLTKGRPTLARRKNGNTKSDATTANLGFEAKLR
jgi:hypothetical protein